MSVPLPPSALARIEASASIFTAALSVGELVALKEAGYTPVGVAIGTSMHHIGFQPQRWNQSVELGMLTQAMITARGLALSRLEAEATALGASGAIGVTLEMIEHEGAGDVLEFVATGTAVQGGPTGETVWTTQLSGPEMVDLHAAGFQPTAVVVGLCVYHVAHQTMRQAISPNIELPAYTQAFYDGRELALHRMQARAGEVGATGVIGVQVGASSRIWRQHAVEFLATGSAVRST